MYANLPFVDCLQVFDGLLYVGNAPFLYVQIVVAVFVIGNSSAVVVFRSD